MKGVRLLVVLLLVGVILVSGCTSTGNLVKEGNQNTESNIIKEQSNNSSNTPNVQRKNCRELNGYLCSQDYTCLKDWLNSTDSYCCPEQCVVIYKELEKRKVCDDGNSCTNDVIGRHDSLTNYTCFHEKITPCRGNGVCEQEELTENIETQSLCGDVEKVSRPVSSVQSLDCPSSCDDSDSSTIDYYNFTTQKCEHIVC